MSDDSFAGFESGWPLGGVLRRLDVTSPGSPFHRPAAATGSDTPRHPRQKVCLHQTAQLPSRLNRPSSASATLVVNHNSLLNGIAIVLDDSSFYSRLFALHILRQSMNKPSTVSIFRFCEACDEPG